LRFGSWDSPFELIAWYGWNTSAYRPDDVCGDGEGAAIGFGDDAQGGHRLDAKDVGAGGEQVGGSRAEGDGEGGTNIGKRSQRGISSLDTVEIQQTGIGVDEDQRVSVGRR
jgi:hypothetical protein